MSHQPGNLSAGTQVVSRVEIRGPNHSLVHPCGAVGVITRTPAVAGEAFLVRFPDGFEKALGAEQFEVLQHFKDRLGAVGTGGEWSGFDLEALVIFRCVVGSRAYGLETAESDTDRRGVYLAPAEMEWSLFGAPEQFEDPAGQSCYWELRKFLVMALRANPNILECLYSPLIEKITPLGEELIALRAGFLSRMIFQTFNGYAMSQFKKIEQDLRNQGEVRWKHAMHLLRLLSSGAATLRQGIVPVRVEAERERLLAVKRGEVSWAELDAWRQELHRDFERALAETRLPERPDYAAANQFLIRARRGNVRLRPPTRAMLRFASRGRPRRLHGCPLTLVVLWFACLASFGSEPSNPSERARSEPAISLDTARRVLDLEARIGPVSDARRQVLDTVMSDACASVQASIGFGSTARRGERRRAEAVLAGIDAVLLRHGFVYPDVGGVDRLTDALTPFTMSVGRRAAFEAHAYNQRRKAMIDERFPGPFFPLDCDTASFIYLGVADRLGLPLRLVVIPSHGRHPGHAFVRWRGPDFFVNWETGMGAPRRDEDYAREWQVSRREIDAGAALVDLTDNQVFGCVHYLAALRYQRRRDTGLALAELARARELFPQHLDIRREAAWRMATVAELPSRQDARAIEDARYVVRLADGADARDTLAAAYASAGLYAEAIREARAAIASSAEFAAARSGYRERLALYRRGRPYREFDAGRSAVPSASFTP